MSVLHAIFILCDILCDATLFVVVNQRAPFTFSTHLHSRIS
jgi:hypothetical protein